MILDILIIGVNVAVLVLAITLAAKLTKAEDHIIKLAMKVAELEDAIRRVDESTGMELNRIGRELKDYQSLYGEAAVEEIRESARAQKAWADGVNSIMNFGAQYQHGGEGQCAKISLASSRGKTSQAWISSGTFMRMRKHSIKGSIWTKQLRRTKTSMSVNSLPTLNP